MKKLLGIIIVVLAVFLIYIGFKDKDIYYLTLGDGLSLGTAPYGGNDYGYSDYIRDYLKESNKLETYVNEFSVANYRTTDLIRDIKDNVKKEVDGKEKTIQNVLIKADLITLSIGFNDLLVSMDFSQDFTLKDFEYRFEGVLNDLSELFDLMRQYCKEKIIIIGFYDPTNNPDLTDFFTYVNSKVKITAEDYNIIYIDSYNIMKDNDFFPNEKTIFPSKNGYKAISDEIIKQIKDFVEKE